MITTVSNHGPDQSTNRASVLADLWEESSSGPVWHPPTCGCGAAAVMPVISMASATADLIDFLFVSSKERNDNSAMAVISSLQNGQPFADWLRTLPTSDLSSPSLDRILDQIEIFIASLKPARGCQPR